MVETSIDQILQQSFVKQNMTKMPHRFYRHVTYDKQLHSYIFTGNNALVPVETSMYVTFHKPTRRNFRNNKKTRQFK